MRKHVRKLIEGHNGSDVPIEGDPIKGIAVCFGQEVGDGNILDAANPDVIAVHSGLSNEELGCSANPLYKDPAGSVAHLFEDGQAVDKTIDPFWRTFRRSKTVPDFSDDEGNLDSTSDEELPQAVLDLETVREPFPYGQYGVPEVKF